jgi:hypothetical protein
VNTTAQELLRRMTLGDDPALLGWTRLATAVLADAHIAAASAGYSLYVFWV